MQVTRAVSPMLVAALLALACAPSAFAQVGGDPYFEFLMARRLDAQGDAPASLAALERAAAADPRSASVQAEIAGLHLRQNRQDQAEAAAKAALALDSESTEGHRVLGMVFAAKSEVTGRVQQSQLPQIAADVREAIVHLDAASQSPAVASDIQLFYTLGRLYLRNSEATKAVQALSKVVALNPESVQGRLTLAQAYMAAQDSAGAIEALEAVVDEEPRVAGALGQYLEQAGRPADAAGAYAKGIEAAPMNRELKFRRVSALMAAKNFAEAATAAAQAQAEHPDDLRFPRLRARALVATGSPARAVEVLEPVATANPGDESVQFALADLYTDTGRGTDAERLMRQYLSIEPGSADAMNYLGYLLANRGQQLDEAIQLVQRALDIEPGNPSYLDSLGWAYYRRGDLVQAERYLMPAADQLPRNSVIQDHLGDLYAKQSKWQAAIAAWSRALEGDTGDIDRAAVTAKIANARTRTR